MNWMNHFIEFENTFQFIFTLIVFLMITVFLIKKWDIKIRWLITSFLFLVLIFTWVIFSLFKLSEIFWEDKLMFIFPIFIIWILWIWYYIFQQRKKENLEMKIEEKKIEKIDVDKVSKNLNTMLVLWILFTLIFFLWDNFYNFLKNIF